MGLKERAEISVGGPDGQGTWGDEGDSFTLQNHTTISVTTTAPGPFPAQTITRGNTIMAGNQLAPDTLPNAGAPIQTWSGIQVSNGATSMAAATNLNFYFRVCRNIGLGTAITASVAITQITSGSPLVAPIPSGASIYLTNVTGNTQTVVTSAAVAAGQTIIPITSVTPGSAYPTGTPGLMNGTSAVLAVGGLGTNLTSSTGGAITTDACFGWLVANTGTPLFPANGTVIAPALATNTAVVNGMLTMCESDNLQVFLITGSSTFTMQVVNCQPLLV
jgi:hypothetical protein